jgi:hypothetical protein
METEKEIWGQRWRYGGQRSKIGDRQVVYGVRAGKTGTDKGCRVREDIWDRKQDLRKGKGIWGHRWDMRTEMVHRDMEEHTGTEQWDMWTELGEGDGQGDTETTVRFSVWGQKREKW